MAKFWAVHQHDRTYWQPDPAYKAQRLIILDDGTIAVLTDMVREGWRLSLLPEYLKTDVPPTEVEPAAVMKECPCCRGSGETMEIVDHDEEYNSVWDRVQCSKCNGTGRVVHK